MHRVAQSYDICVCGGGLAGVSAAVSAARLGLNVCLLQDRPVLGGNSSSEIRVTPHGAACFHAYARETGIISELLIRERATNHEEILENGWMNSVWDLLLYDLATTTPNLVLHLNSTVRSVELSGLRRISKVFATVANSEVDLEISAKYFVDCSGDGVIAALSGCEWRMGTESRAEFNEPHAPLEASAATMGSSIMFKAKDMGRPVPFSAPAWAAKYDNPDFFYKGGRQPWDIRAGYWWIEIGVPWHTVHDNETIRHELTRHVLGVWDWIKNRDPKTMDRAKNYALDWVGQVPGKRESRRIMGRYLLTEHDVLNRKVFEDEIAYGGWFVDLHTPGGLLAETSEPSSAENHRVDTEYAIRSYCGPYGIPLRSLLSKDISNLLMAGRNISVTHAALGTVRVMGTTALMGQAAGTAAALALKSKHDPANPTHEFFRAVQQQLLRDDCFLLSARNQDPRDMALEAEVTASSEALLVGVGPGSSWEIGGMNRWRVYDDEGRLYVRKGQSIAVVPGILKAISVCLSNVSDTLKTLRYTIGRQDHIWDYRAELPVLHAGEIEVPVGKRSWIKLELNIQIPDARFIRLDLEGGSDLIWHEADAVEPGMVSVFEMGEKRMRRQKDGVSLSFVVDPPQNCFGPRNVITGVSRPYAIPNVWKSDPRMPLPQWLQLSWSAPKNLSRIELTFAGNLLKEYHSYPPFYRDPQCVRDFALFVKRSGGWELVREVKDNYQRKISVSFTPIETEAMQIVIYATNGDPSAQIYEVRCY